MSESQNETKRLAAAVANIAATIAEIIDVRVKERWERELEGAMDRGEIGPASFEKSWVGKRIVAKHFAVTTRTIDNWVKRGLLPHIRLGRNVRFKLRDVDDSVRQNMNVRWR
jgi:excisionase family DNA binding protein